MLSDRRQRVLSALIEEYVRRALPVGSRTINERYHLGVSSATIRNDLSALEDAGYITQPHTSAGRIPTDAGYRAFVDELLSSGSVEECPYEDIVSQLRQSASELDALMEKTSATLARLTECLSIVMAPSAVSSSIRQLSLISLSNYRALIVIVDEQGRVLNRQLVFSEEVSPQRLAEAQQLLNRLLVGCSLRDIDESDRQFTSEFLREPFFQLLLDEVVECLRENNVAQTHRLGMASLMRKPEFRSSHALVPLVEMLEDNAVLLHVLDDAGYDDEDIAIRIGRENDSQALAGISVIVGSYGRGEGEGIVAVIGPTRMDYNRIIRAVRAAQHILRDD